MKNGIFVHQAFLDCLICASYCARHVLIMQIVCWLKKESSQGNWYIGQQQATSGPVWGDSTEKRLILGIFLMDRSSGPGRDRREWFPWRGKNTRENIVIQKIWVHLGVGSSLVCLEWAVCVCVCVCEWHKTMLEADWGPCCPKKGINFILEALRSWKGLQ